MQARLHPAKGLGLLVDAFVLLKRGDRVKNLRLRVAGAQTAADAPYVRSLRQRLAAAGIAGHAEFVPNPDRAAKQEFLRRLSVFPVPAMAGEAFGLYVLEALASGVPVVQVFTTHGYGFEPDQELEGDPLPEGRTTLAEEFIYHLETGEPLHPTLDMMQNLQVMAILDAGIRSAASGKVELVNDANWCIG